MPDDIAKPPAPTLQESRLTTALQKQHHVRLSELFAETGPLAQTIDGFRPRQSQLEMAAGITQAIESHSTFIAEAGTGTGKTFAYLVPALLWGGKVIISTGTKNLQDQIFLRDIPTVRNALTLPVSVALLKGRANYVCHYHLARVTEYGRLPSKEDVAYLRQIERFLKTSQTGDKAELNSVPEGASIWPLVTSTRDNCVGTDCTHYKDCFVMKARKAAQEADVVVVNHHLFFADLMLRDAGVSELLPTANTIIFDEAHQLPDTATLFFGESVSTSQLLELARDTQAEGLVHARDGADWVTLAGALEKAARDTRLAFGQDSSKLSRPQLAASSPFFMAAPTVTTALSHLKTVLEQQAERAETLAQCLNRCVDLLLRWQNWLRDEQTDLPGCESVRWLEIFASSLTLHQTPLSVADIFTKQREGPPRAWIFTSATLSMRGKTIEERFAHYASQLGLSASQAGLWPSPFDFATQALLYVPKGLPAPASPQFNNAMIDTVLPLIHAAHREKAGEKGGTFILCTTLRAVRATAQRLREEADAGRFDYPLMVQGEAGKTELLERFRQAGNAVLVGSQSFWEGVDVRGRALSLVIIDKLPFAPPDDPVLAARLAVMEKSGGNPFMDFQIPNAVITLKQGAGRLIRGEDDRGVLVICDARLVDKPYGRLIWQSLPPFTRTREAQTVIDFFEGADV
ncbi:ATP-dependent DNA helicase [Ampullimonas aquatilis]|uniref:ATP-dependent DNA helicase n=1 Tax=Ampullimonas aquatilis TaxID=1341549 RepID=UPI003C732B02